MEEAFHLLFDESFAANGTFIGWEEYLTGGHDVCVENGIFPPEHTHCEGPPISLDDISKVCDEFDKCIEALWMLCDDTSETVVDLQTKIETVTAVFETAVEHEVSRTPVMDNEFCLHDRVKHVLDRNFLDYTKQYVHSKSVTVPRKEVK